MQGECQKAEQTPEAGSRLRLGSKMKTRSVNKKARKRKNKDRDLGIRATYSAICSRRGPLSRSYSTLGITVGVRNTKCKTSCPHPKETYSPVPGFQI